MPARRPTDEDLLASSPGREDFASFYVRYEDAILAYFLRRTASPELAADLAAETFAQALASRGAFRRSRGSAVAWLFGIAGHVLARSMRRGRVEDRARRRLGMQPLLLADTDLDRVEELADTEAVAAALEALPADQRTAIRARVIDGQPYATLAADLRCSEAVVRQRVSRGLATLRAQLADQQ